MLRGKVSRLAKVASEIENASRSCVYLMFQAEMQSPCFDLKAEKLRSFQYCGREIIGQKIRVGETIKTIITT